MSKSFDHFGYMGGLMRSAKTYVAAIWVFVSLAVFSARAEASDFREGFDSGNKFYEQGDYPVAIAEYEKARLSGEVSAALYYNLAGAYLKSGDLGRAILNYQRAAIIAPRDPDIASNQSFARSMVTGKEAQRRGFFAWRPVRVYSRFFTTNEISLIASALFFMFFIALAAAAVYENMRARLLLLCAVLAVGVTVNLAVIFHKVKLSGSYAVTVSPEADALFAPFDSATKFFTLHEGNGVIVLETKSPWCRVRRSDGMVGWVKLSDIERI